MNSLSQNQLPDSWNYSNKAVVGAYKPIEIKDYNDNHAIGFSRAEVLKSAHTYSGSDHRRLKGDVYLEVHIFYKGREFSFIKAYKRDPQSYDLHKRLNEVTRIVEEALQSSLDSSLNSIDNYKSGKKDPNIGKKSLKPQVLNDLEKENISVKVNKCKKEISYKDLAGEKGAKEFFKKEAPMPLPDDLITQQVKNKIIIFTEKTKEKISRKIAKEEKPKKIKKEKKTQDKSKAKRFNQMVRQPPVDETKKVMRVWGEEGYSIIKQQDEKIEKT